MATTPKSSRGNCSSGSSCEPTGPDEYEQILLAFERDYQAAMEEFPRYLENLGEIWLVEFTFSDNPATSESDGPINRMEFGQRLAEARAWELGEGTHVPAGRDRPGGKHSTR